MCVFVIGRWVDLTFDVTVISILRVFLRLYILYAPLGKLRNELNQLQLS